MRRTGDRGDAPPPGRLSGSDTTDCRAPGPTSCAASGRSAAGASTTDGRICQSTATSSAASRAAARVSATTNATGSPTWRTRSDRQCEARRHDHRCDARHRHGARQRAEIGKIGGGEHADHAWRCARRRGIDAFDRGMGVRRTHDLHPGLAGNVDIVDVAAAPGQEARVLQPAQRLAAERHAMPAPLARRAPAGPASAPVASPSRYTGTPETIVAT